MTKRLVVCMRWRPGGEGADPETVSSPALSASAGWLGAAVALLPLPQPPTNKPVTASKKVQYQRARLFPLSFSTHN
jgi:hypothetical protein